LTVEELEKVVGSLNREQKLEILAKMGIKLRKALREDQDRVPDVRLSAYFCPIELLEEYDKMMALLKE
jgi:hypothetical protein